VPDTPAPRALTLTTVTAVDGFASLRAEWNALLASSRADSIFLTWEWLWTWWQVFGTGRALRLLTVRDPDGRLVAIAPIALRETRHLGVRARTLELLATGEPPTDAIWSERLDLIVANGHEARVIAAVADHLAGSMRDEWHDIHFTNTLAGSLAGDVVRALADSGRRSAFVPQTSSLAVALPADPAAIPHLLGPRTRRKLGAYVRSIEARGGLTFEPCQNAEAVLPTLDRLIALHQQRWNARGEPGVFASANFTTFHRRVAPLLFERGQLRLSTLSVGGRAVAVLCAFANGGTISAYQSGFDVTFDPRVSLGLVAYALGMGDAARHGYGEWDFLRGLEPYKSWWPVVERRYEDAHAWNTGVRASASWYAFAAEQAARRAIRHTRTLLRRVESGGAR
jgi:CelD/BcsL family acetyltransferase involved in cellulose biosynthesis